MRLSLSFLSRAIVYGMQNRAVQARDNELEDISAISTITTACCSSFCAVKSTACRCLDSMLQGMLDFDFMCKRKTPSVCAMVPSGIANTRGVSGALICKARRSCNNKGLSASTSPTMRRRTHEAILRGSSLAVHEFKHLCCFAWHVFPFSGNHDVKFYWGTEDRQ